MTDRPETRRPTIADVARHAGVSESTVSQVLSGRRPVAASTAERVRASIAELGFRPNAVARALRTQTSHTVAFVVPNIAHVLYPLVARGVGEVLKPLGYHVTIYETDDSPVLCAELVRAAVDRGIDGAILFGFTLTADVAEILRTHRVPFVNGGLNEDVVPPWDSVRSDQEAGMAATTRFALELSSGPIAFIGGHFGAGPADLREQAFRAAMAAADRPVDESLVARSDYSYPGGRQAMEEILARGPVPRSVVCANDLIAIGAMSLAVDHGLEVPTDVTFSGYDNIEACDMVVPPLTSVETDLQEQGRACSRMLLDRLGARSGAAAAPPRHLVTPTRPVQRRSTASGRLNLVATTGEPAQARTSVAPLP